VAVGILLLTGLPTSGVPSSQLMGGGLIGAPIQGKTINSPSDFGLAVTADGGTFVCSMAGPLTGNFMGMTVMTVEGPVNERHAQNHRQHGVVCRQRHGGPGSRHEERTRRGPQ
jgi:hypothetical protein